MKIFTGIFPVVLLLLAAQIAFLGCSRKTTININYLIHHPDFFNKERIACALKGDKEDQYCQQIDSIFKEEREIIRQLYIDPQLLGKRIIEQEIELSQPDSKKAKKERERTKLNLDLTRAIVASIETP